MLHTLLLLWVSLMINLYRFFCKCVSFSELSVVNCLWSQLCISVHCEDFSIQSLASKCL